MRRFEVPDGWTAQAYRFALDPTPVQARSLRSHAGGARKAFNHMLARVKAVMDQRAAERSYGITDNDRTPPLGWSLPALRKMWNVDKHVVAPWWGENSKEAYNTGLDALARALDAWAKSRAGDRAGRPVGFPASRASGPGAAFVSRPGPSGSSPTGTTSPCRAWVRFALTSPPGNSPAGLRRGRRGCCR